MLHEDLMYLSTVPPEILALEKASRDFDRGIVFYENNSGNKKIHMMVIEKTAFKWKMVLFFLPHFSISGQRKVSFLCSTQPAAYNYFFEDRQRFCEEGLIT